MYYVYLIQSKIRNETYIGSTNDLRKRIQEHNSGLSGSTNRYKPWRLVSYEAYQSEEDARTREHKLKAHGNALREFKKRAIHSLKSSIIFKKSGDLNSEGLKGKGLPSTISLRNGAGFTLLEMIVAVSILVGAIMGPIAVAVSGINAATSAKNRILANYLAMEAMEVLKNRQYTNFINMPPFGFGEDISNIGGVGGTHCLVSGPPPQYHECRVDAWDPNEPSSVCNQLADCDLWINSTIDEGIKYGHQYNFPTWTWTKAPNNLRRFFHVEEIGIDQLLITVTVEWTEKGVPKSVVLEDYLQNWGN